MVSLKATIREKIGRQTKTLRKQGVLPAVLYGEGLESTPIEVEEKDFNEVYAKAGESSLVSLALGSKKYDVLIHEISRDPLSGGFLHIDFYHPSTKKKVEAEIPLVFEGVAPAVGDLGGILVKELQAINVKGLAHNLPREIVVDIGTLQTFEDRIRVKDLKVPEGVEVLRGQEGMVALVVAPKEEKEEAAPAAQVKPEAAPAAEAAAEKHKT